MGVPKSFTTEDTEDTEVHTGRAYGAAHGKNSVTKARKRHSDRRPATPAARASKQASTAKASRVLKCFCDRRLFRCAVRFADRSPCWLLCELCAGRIAVCVLCVLSVIVQCAFAIFSTIFWASGRLTLQVGIVDAALRERQAAPAGAVVGVERLDRFGSSSPE